MNAELVRAGFQAFNAGRTIEYVSHEFYRIADGLIAEEWICSDTATLPAQLPAHVVRGHWTRFRLGVLGRGVMVRSSPW